MSTRLKKCAVTGANGLVGAALKAELERRGCEVVSLVRQPRGPGETAFQLGQPVDPEALAGVETLVHCAYDFKAFTWEEIRAINVEGSLSLFRAATAAGVKRIVFISSISAFEGCRSLYGRGKLEVEAYVRSIGGVVVRPGLVYGVEGLGMFGALGRMTKLPVLPVFGSGGQPFFLVHVSDLAVAIANACEGAAPARPVLAANDKPIAFGELLRAIARGQGRKVRLLPVPGWMGLAGLRLLEKVGLRPGFRSDSLVSMLYYDPSPDFKGSEALGVKFRNIKV